jgi:hypothetical protein
MPNRVPELTVFSHWLTLVTDGSPRRDIFFEPGKYGRMDNFILWEFGLYRRGRSLQPTYWKRIGQFSTDPDTDTLAVLRLLDEAVATDPKLVFDRHFGGSWTRIADKAEFAKPSTPPISSRLYERRLAEQQLILNGKLKRGHKAFGYYPLEGGT